ncbi:MAG: PilZ domain-containing protein [Acidobacteriota bacterium]
MADKLPVQRNRPPRYKPRESIPVTVLALLQAPTEGTIANVSTRGLALRLHEPIPTESWVQVSVKDTTLVGQVQYCGAAGHGHMIGVEIQHSLKRLEQLRKLNKLIAEETDALERYVDSFVLRK